MTDSERSRRSGPTDPAGIERPHDVLAAEEFGIPTRDSGVPGDPTGIREPHDVLAAEEFAMPAGAEPHGASAGHEAAAEDARRAARAYLPLALAVLVLLLVLRRRR